jgi:hypothetical protein
MLFIYPSIGRCKEETSSNDGENDDENDNENDNLKPET